MALLVVICAAVVSGGASLVIPESKNRRVRQLSRAYWLTAAVLLAGGLIQGGGLGAFIHPEKLGGHAATGIVLVALIMVVWTTYCLFNGFGRGDER